MSGRSAWIHAALLAGYLVLAVLHTYPLVRHLETHLPGQGLGDNVSFVWNGWWMREALSSPAYDFFASPLIEAPIGAPLILHTHSALTAFVGATLLSSLPLVTAQNILLIVSLALNGMAAYLLSWIVTRARGPSILAGALFLVTPPIAARLMGHYNLVLVWPLGFACAAYVSWWGAPQVSRAVLAGATAALIPYADYYYAVYFVLFAVVYALVTLWRARVTADHRSQTWISLLLSGLAAIAVVIGLWIAVTPAFELNLAGANVSVGTPTNALTAAWLLAAAAALGRWRPRLEITRRQTVPRHFSRDLSIALLVFVVLLAPLIVPAWTVLSSGDYVTQTSSIKTGPHGVDMITAVLGPPFSGAAGPFVRSAYQRLGIDVMESSVWIGLAPLLLLMVSLRGGSFTPEARRWTVMAVAFLIWAMGPYLIVLGFNTGLLLPQAVAHVLPFVNNARIPARAMAVCALALAVLVSVALSARQRPMPRWSVLLLVAFAMLESIAAPLPLAALPFAGVYADLAARAEPGSVLTIPFGVRDGFGEQGRLEHESLYGQTIHGRPLVGGFVARLPPRVWSWYDANEPYRTLLILSASATASTPLPTCDAMRAGLRAAAVSYVVLYPGEASPTLRAMVEQRMPLLRIGQDDHRILFAVDLTRREPCRP